MKHLPTSLLLSTLAVALSAQAHNLVPAAKQTQSVLIKNATVHTVSQGTLTNTDVLIEQGKISAIGPQLSVNGADSQAQVIDATGKHLYPGLIALDTSLGLVEIEMVRPTVDNAEVGDFNPQISAATAYNPDSE